MRRSFVTFLSILLFLSVLVLGGAILSNKSGAQPPPNPPDHPGATEIHWALIRTYSGPSPYVEYGSHPSISVVEMVEGEWGRYIVTFPSNFEVLACTATLHDATGIITAVPGRVDGVGSSPYNQVLILIQTLPVNGFGLRDFTVVAYSKRGPN